MTILLTAYLIIIGVPMILYFILLFRIDNDQSIGDTAFFITFTFLTITFWILLYHGFLDIIRFHKEKRLKKKSIQMVRNLYKTYEHDC